MHYSKGNTEKKLGKIHLPHRGLMHMPQIWSAREYPIFLEHEMHILKQNTLTTGIKTEMQGILVFIKVKNIHCSITEHCTRGSYHNYCYGITNTNASAKLSSPLATGPNFQLGLNSATQIECNMYIYTHKGFRDFNVHSL